MNGVLGYPILGLLFSVIPFLSYQKLITLFGVLNVSIAVEVGLYKV